MYHNIPRSTVGLQSARCLHARALQRMIGPDAAGPNEAVESSTKAGLITSEGIPWVLTWAVHCTMTPSAHFLPSHPPSPPDPSHPPCKNGVLRCRDLVPVWRIGGVRSYGLMSTLREQVYLMYGRTWRAAADITCLT